MGVTIIISAGVGVTVGGNHIIVAVGTKVGDGVAVSGMEVGVRITGKISQDEQKIMINKATQYIFFTTILLS